MAKRNKNKIRLSAETPTIVVTQDTEHIEGKTYYVQQEDETWRVAEDSDFGPEGAFVAGTVYGEEAADPEEPEEEVPPEEPVTPPADDPTPPAEGEDTPGEKDDDEEEEEKPKRIFETHKSCKSLYCVNIMRPRRSRFVKEGE